MQYNAKAAQGTMMKRSGLAEEVIAAILFLALEDASYVTGPLLLVDGGDEGDVRGVSGAHGPCCSLCCSVIGSCNHGPILPHYAKTLLTCDRPCLSVLISTLSSLPT